MKYFKSLQTLGSPKRNLYLDNSLLFSVAEVKGQTTQKLRNKNLPSHIWQNIQTNDRSIYDSHECTVWELFRPVFRLNFAFCGNPFNWLAQLCEITMSFSRSVKNVNSNRNFTRLNNVARKLIVQLPFRRYFLCCSNSN